MPTDLVVSAPAGPMELIQQALSSGTSPEVIRELVALQQSMERFNWEREERQEEREFGEALTRCQAKIGLLKPNQGRKRKRTDTHDSIFWLDYVGLDRDIRPIYIAEGFSISFSEVEEGKDGYVGMKAFLSRGRITREYFKQLTLEAAFDGMPKADAEASAASRVKRYLLIQIFNVAIGIDVDEKKPFNEGGALPDIRYIDLMAEIEGAANRIALQKAFGRAWTEAKGIGDSDSQAKFQKKYDELKKEL